MSGNDSFEAVPTPNPNTQPLVSDLAQDPDMADLVDLFVDELADRIDSLQQALAEQDLEQLRSLTHQLKGAAGGYGFMPITESAACVEQQIIAGDTINDIEQSLNDLVSLCNRATGSK